LPNIDPAVIFNVLKLNTSHSVVQEENSKDAAESPELAAAQELISKVEGS
jgi:hypothetical protein